MKSPHSNYDHQLTCSHRDCTNCFAIATCDRMTGDQFYEFCQLNRDFRIERNAFGELVIMSPTDAETGQRNFEVIGQLGI